jgi:hypothetical protein
MMRLARRASLLVAFFLLTSAATAYAECAWVLWTETRTFRGEPVTWTFNRKVHDTRNACELALPTAIDANVDTYVGLGYSRLPSDQAFPASGRFVRKDRVSLSVTAGSSDQPALTTVHEFHCLPDTVDPRGVRGK